MKRLKEEDVFGIQVTRQDARDLYHFFNSYLNMNPEKKDKNDREYENAKKFAEFFSFSND